MKEGSIPCESIHENALPVTIIRFPTVADIGSRNDTDAMAKVFTVHLDFLPQLPQTSLPQKESKTLRSLFSLSVS